MAHRVCLKHSEASQGRLSLSHPYGPTGWQDSGVFVFAVERVPDDVLPANVCDLEPGDIIGFPRARIRKEA